MLVPDRLLAEIEPEKLAPDNAAKPECPQLSPVLVPERLLAEMEPEKLPVIA